MELGDFANISPENLEEAEQLIDNGGEELEAICSEMAISEPEIFEAGYQLEVELRAQGIDYQNSRYMLRVSGIHMIAQYFQKRRASLDHLLGDVLGA